MIEVNYNLNYSNDGWELKKGTRPRRPKVSIITTTFEKNHQIENTLYGILRQQTNFPFELIIVDDGSTQDPSILIREFLQEYIPTSNCTNLVKIKYKRREENITARFVRKYCFEMLDDKSEIIVSMTADIVMLDDKTLQVLHDQVRIKNPVFCETLEWKTTPEWYEDFDTHVPQILSDWRRQITGSKGRKLTFDKEPETRCPSPIVSRRWPVGLVFHCGAIYRSDCMEIGYDENSCDAVISKKIRYHKFQGHILAGFARCLAQNHLRKLFPCVLENTCSYYCPRTARTQGLRRPKLKPGKIIYAPGEPILPKPPLPTRRLPREVRDEQRRLQAASAQPAAPRRWGENRKPLDFEDTRWSQRNKK